MEETGRNPLKKRETRSGRKKRRNRRKEKKQRKRQKCRKIIQREEIEAPASAAEEEGGKAHADKVKEAEDRSTRTGGREIERARERERVERSSG